MKVDIPVTDTEHAKKDVLIASAVGKEFFFFFGQAIILAQFVSQRLRQ